MLNNHEPIFGKNVIETLSEGMYDNPLFLYREYVQNAADAIDAAVDAGVLQKGAGQILVSIDPDERIIEFSDNGIGIAKRNVPSMLANIGNSQKDRLKNKGFRGIGRLGGLGYCRVVRFETSVCGESVKSVLEWDAAELHRILSDASEQIDAGALIKRITSVRTEKEDPEEHYFRVSLIDVVETSDDLLDVDDVRQYLSMVAPVPFDYSRFRFVSDIEAFIRANNLPSLHEYALYVNDDQVRKGYETPLTIAGTNKEVEVLGVECRLLKSADKIVGWYWFCISKFEGVLPKACWQRCIRLRKENIQIGEADCLSNHPKRGQTLWKEDRGPHYFMGEIHALDKRLIPNSRRDYFNQDEACRAFEEALSEQFVELHQTYHIASDCRSAAQAIQKAAAEIKSFKEKERTGGFYEDKDRDAAYRHVEELKGKAEKAKAVLGKYAEQFSGSEEPAARVFGTYRDVVTKALPSVSKPANNSKPNIKDKLNKNTKDVLDKVLAIVEAVLPPAEASLLKTAILKRFG